MSRELKGTSGVSQGVNMDVKGVRGSRGRQGGPGWVRGGVKVFKEVKTSVRGVSGVEGDPWG